MSGRPWYKRYGAAFVHGSLGLTLEQKGAYSLCLDLIYDRGGPIPDDARWLAGVCGVSLRKWSSLREALVAAGKLVEIDGHLTNHRAEKELETAAKTARILAENGSKGGLKRAENAAEANENRELDQAGLKHRAQVQKLEVREEVSSLRSDTARDEAKEAFDGYNERAHRVGWPVAETLNADRRKRLRGRIAEAGGVDGFLAALDRGTRSDFLVKGTDSSSWRPGLDFFLQAKSFTKLREGAYDNRGRSSAPPPAAPPPAETVSIDTLVALYRRGHWGNRYGGEPGYLSCNLPDEMQRRILIAASSEDVARRRAPHLFDHATADGAGA